MKFTTFTAFALTLATKSEAIDSWTDYILSDGDVECADTSSALVTGFGCKGSYCDDVRVYCRGGESPFVTSDSYWTEEVSEEMEPAMCKDDYFMTGVSCKGHYCDNLKLQCTYSQGRIAGECTWSDWVSEEGTGLIDFSASNTFVRGLECKGSFCDNKRFYVCPALEGTRAPTSAPTTFEEFVENTSGSCIYNWTDYVVIDHSAQADKGQVDCGEAGGLVAGAQCLAHYCDDVKLLCKTCGCEYRETASYWTEPVTSASPVAVCESDHFMTGITCADHFCSNITMQCTYNEGRTAGTECVWSDWVSEEHSEGISFAATGYATGIECRGTYCDDKRFLLCPAIEASEEVCSTVPWSAVPSAAPSVAHSSGPSAIHSDTPSVLPSSKPTPSPTGSPSASPSETHSYSPSVSMRPSASPTVTPSAKPSALPSASPSEAKCNIDWTEYAVVDHSPGADQGEVDCGDPNSMVVGAQCLSHYCDDVRLLCKHCDCTYTVNDSYWTEAFSDEDPAMICNDDYFMTGLGCDDNFCDQVSLQCTKSTGRTSGTECVWSDWVSDEGDAQVTFEDIGYARGVQCSGRYCDNKRFYLCPAIDDPAACPWF